MNWNGSDTMNATNPENTSSESTPTQWMMKQLKDLSGVVISLQAELKDLSGVVISLQAELDDGVYWPRAIFPVRQRTTAFSAAGAA